MTLSTVFKTVGRWFVEVLAAVYKWWHRQGHMTREMVKTDKPAKKTNPVKLKVLRGSADGFASLRDQKITRPGLEPTQQNTGETALSENGGHPGGQFGRDSETVASLRQTALTQLAAASKTLERLKAMPASQAERKALADACGLLQRGTSCLLNGFK